MPEKISKLKTHNKELNITPINFYPLNKLYSMILENLDSISQSRYPEIKSTATFIFSQCNKNALLIKQYIYKDCCQNSCQFINFLKNILKYNYTSDSDHSGIITFSDRNGLLHFN